MTDSNGTKLAMYSGTVGLVGKREIEKDVDDLVDKLGEWLCGYAIQRVGEAGVFHLAVSGGSTPEKLYVRLMTDPRYRLMPWAKTHLWMVDDRCVPADDERSNQRMLNELLVEHSGIPRGQAHMMPVMEAGGAERYEAEMRGWLDVEGVDGRLDCVLLGMGGDGHTASLFPQSPALGEGERWVVLNDGERVIEPRPRMTMTYPLINGARRIGVLVTGGGKREMLGRVSDAGVNGEGDVMELPILGVTPTDDDTELTWWLDSAAACGDGV